MKSLKEIIVFRNGNIAAIDNDGNQIPELHSNIVTAVIGEAKELGISTGSVRVSWPCDKYNYVERTNFDV
tara:strand:- start:976 stop:1185 length:210 start_codon:yes stop_codon:yes gene_type:complete